MISYINPTWTIEQIECKIQRMFKRGFVVLNVNCSNGEIKLHWGIIEGSKADEHDKRMQQERGQYGF